MMALGAGLGAAGGVSSFMGGKSEAKRKQRAIDQYKRDSARIYDEMAKNAWQQGTRRQGALRSMLTQLPATMGSEASAAPQVSDYIPAAGEDTTGFRGAEYRQALDAAQAPLADVSQSQLTADQAGIDMGELMRAIGNLDYGSSVEVNADAPRYSRTQYLKDRELEEAKRRLESILGSTGNKARNLQLLGSLLNTGGNMAMMGASGMGGAGNGLSTISAADLAGAL